MLEPILKGLVEWLYEMMVDIMAYASGQLLGVMSMDLHYFEQTAPIISDIVNIFIALGWALLMGNMVFQLTKSMVSGIGFEGEDPKMIFLRTFVFAFLLLASRQICEIGLSITGMVINMLGLPGSITVTAPNEGLFSLGGNAKWLLVIIVGVILMVQMVKLLFEIGERYVVMSVLTYFAPLAFSMGGSRNTNDIFKGWCRMYGAMMVMMIMNIVFLKLIMSAMSQMASGNVLIWLVFVVALTRVARKIDSHIGKIGLNPAQTGDAIGGRFPGAVTMMAVRMMASAIGKSVAANKNTRSDGNHSGEKRHGAGGAAAGNRNFAGSRYTGGTTGGNTYAENNSHAGGGEHSGMEKTAPGGNPPGETTKNHKNMGNTQNPAGNTPPVTARGVQNIHRQDLQQMGGTQTGNRPPLDRRTGTGKGSLPRPGTVPLPKPGMGTQSVDVSGEHGADIAKTTPGASPQFRVGRGINGSVITPGSLSGKESQGGVSTDGKQASGNNSTIINSRTNGKKPDNQNGRNTNVQNRKQIERNGIPSRDMVQGVEKSSATHTERDMREIFSKEREQERFAENQSHSAMYHQRQDKDRHSEEHHEMKVDHAYKHGRYNPAAQNRKTRQNFYRKQKQGGFPGHRENRGIRNNRDRRRGEGNRKRKWEK